MCRSTARFSSMLRLMSAHQHQTPPSPRERGEGEDEGRAPSVAGIPTEVEKIARRRPPLIPLPGPSPRRRGEGSRHPGSRGRLEKPAETRPVVAPPLSRMPANVKRPLLPASGEKVRMRGRRHHLQRYRQRWKRSQGAARPSSPCRDLLPADGEKEAVIPGLTRDPLAECARARPGPHPRPWKRFSTCTGHRRGSTATRSKRSERRAWSGWRASQRSAARSIRICA